MKRLIMMTIVLAACGGSEKPITVDKDTKENHPGMDEHGKLTPELAAFHDVLKPLWHQDKGDAQVAATCNAGADLQAKAKAVADAPTPTGVAADAWQQQTLRLGKAVDRLVAVCGADHAQFDESFAEVHNAFHAAMEAEMGEAHDEHMEHMEGMEHGEGMDHH